VSGRVHIPSMQAARLAFKLDPSTPVWDSSGFVGKGMSSSPRKNHSANSGVQDVSTQRRESRHGTGLHSELFEVVVARFGTDELLDPRVPGSYRQQSRIKPAAIV
jgi:hypothetical protein